jgi:RNA polymerase sigma-B factor
MALPLTSASPTAVDDVRTGAPGSTAHAPFPSSGRSHGYEHLAPLFFERQRLTGDAPRRRRLREELIAGYRPVAQNIARKYGYRGENSDDLEQVATLGLILAVDRFDPGRNIDFLSFAVPTITGEVLRHFRDRAAAIRVPRRLRQIQGLIYDTTAELTQRHGRAPRPSEIAAAMDVDVEVVLEGLAALGAGHTSSLDESASDDDGAVGTRTRFDAALGEIEPEFDLVEQREALSPLLAALPERERRILLLRFFGGLTQSEIGEKLGISQMHVSRLLSRTLASLRRQLAAE